MKRTVLSMAAVLAAATSPIPADVVTERWGAGKDAVQHAEAIKFAAGDKGGGIVMTVDLSALPRGAAVYRARLFFFGTKWDDVSFRIFPKENARQPLRLAEPYSTWFDATAAVQAWTTARADKGTLQVKQAPRFARERTYLEIAYEGELDDAPPQATGVRAFYRDGQVFVTFREVQPPDDGKEDISWADLAGRFSGDYYGPVGGPAGGKRRYLLVRHSRPLTPRNVGQAAIVAEVLPGTAFNTREGLKLDARRKREYVVNIKAGGKGEGLSAGADVKVLRVAVENGKPVAAGEGVIVHTVRQAGKFYYAVLTADEGKANTKDMSPSNTAGPIEQRRAAPSPVMYKEIATPLRKARHLQRWYSYWTDQPLSPWPARYDVIVSHCPELLAKPAPLHVGRSGWNSWPVPSRAGETSGLHMAHASDMPVEFHSGLHDAMGTLKGFDGGKWQPFFTNRQDALVRWAFRAFAVDANRISANVGAWGCLELKRGDVFCYLNGWALTELTKGFQSWGRAVAIWGHPRRYTGRPPEEDPYVGTNLTDWVESHPQVELPFLNMYARGGSHWTEMGWPPAPRFLHVMIKTKRAFVYSGRTNPLEAAINKGVIRVRLNESLPALGSCSLDDNPGEGDLRSAENFGAQLNGYVLWDSDSIRDQQDSWEIILWIDESSYHPTCTVDLTPRRCQRFKAAPGATYVWTNTLLPGLPKLAKTADTALAVKGDSAAPGKRVQQGTAKADAHGLVTIEKLALTKGRHHVVIRASR